MKRTRWFGTASLLVALSISAAASGPDVIVGDLVGVSDYGSVGGIHAYAIGTTSCNIGDTPLTWNANTPNHPVISQNAYRLSNGRFEQIGQAWLKHGFCALQGTVCSSCTPGGSCGALYPGCSDPYGSGLNGDQSGLGPKSEVNAATGVFPYPWGNNGTGSGATFKRLQIADADLATAGALYFVSSMYVQPEDAANGNDNNNQSYRRCLNTLALQDSTQRGKPAIFAWMDHGLGANLADPDVYLTPIDVASDGRFWLGCKVTSLGGGQYHYEYAIQNLNSHRSGQAFSIPIPAGATVTNVGFRDVPYHSGEPYSGTDWTATVGTSSVSWATQTFAQNANANALRWDTIYNFRFDCNVPPAGGVGTITLFRTGSPSTVTGITQVPSADGQFHPLNDDCIGARPVNEGTFPFNTTNATTDGPDEPTACNFASYTNVGADIWYLYTPTCPGTVTVSTCGSTFDTKVAVYNAACPSTASAISCNDDSNTCGTNSLQSVTTFTASLGNSYLIRVGGYNALTGTGTLTISAPGCGSTPPTNDACAGAIWLASGVGVAGTTSNATNDGTANCGQSTTSPDVWYLYRPTVNGTVTVTTCGSTNSYDTVLSAYTGACGALTQIACNDDNCGLLSTITFTGTAYTNYYIRVAGYQGATGSFTVTASGGSGVIPPANDDCANRAGIGLGTTAFSTLGTTTDGPTHALCNNAGTQLITGDIWYNHPAQATGTLTIATCGNANFNTRIAVYSGAGCTDLATRILACNDDACSTQSSISLSVVQGNNYTIRLGGTNARGTGSLTLSMQTDTPPNVTQDPSNVTVCSGGQAQFTVTATGTAPLSYQWRRNTTNLSNGGAISGANSATLTINPVGGGNAGSYDCVVTNNAGSDTSAAATFTVDTAPSISGNPPATQTLCVGGALNLSVTATGTAPLSYQWQRNGGNVNNGGAISGATSASLSINPVAAGNAGTYTCIVTNGCGNATSGGCVVSVNVAPAVTGNPPATQTLCVGGALNLSVTATGTAPLSYQWQRNGGNVNNGGAISGATSASLSINPVAAGDAGTYTCVVTNGCGNATSSGCVLTVNTPVAINIDPVSTTVDAGDTAVFSVTATGTAPLSYQWFRGVNPLSDGGDISGATTATLSIANAEEADEGSYSVDVTNACGTQSSAAATLTVNPVPCPGDLNGDNQVTLTDLAILLANFGTLSGATPAQGDLDNDGDVDLSDLSRLLANFGASC